NMYFLPTGDQIAESCHRQGNILVPNSWDSFRELHETRNLTEFRVVPFSRNRRNILERQESTTVDRTTLLRVGFMIDLDDPDLRINRTERVPRTMDLIYPKINRFYVLMLTVNNVEELQSHLFLVPLAKFILIPRELMWKIGRYGERLYGI